MRARERKPVWLRNVFPDTTRSGTCVVRCGGCGLYVVEDRDGVWTRWDYGLIHGDDLTTAIILDRPLARLEWPPGSMSPRLMTTLGPVGLRVDGDYLALHSCGRQRISVKPVKPPHRRRSEARTWGKGIIPSDTDVEAFTRLWNTPLNELTTNATKGTGT